MVAFGTWETGLWAQANFFNSPAFPLLVTMILAYYWFILMPDRKRRAENQKMMDQLKKNDRIVTIGGIYGTVVNASPESKEVTIRVDDNTRIRVLRSAIANVVTEDSAKDKDSDNKS